MTLVCSRYLNSTLSKTRLLCNFYTSCQQQHQVHRIILANKTPALQPSTLIKKIKKAAKISNELGGVVNDDIWSTELGELLQTYPKRLSKTQTSPDGLYILYTPLAEIVADHVYNGFSFKLPMVFEVNPGPGILTRTMLKQGIKRVRIFESKEEFYPHLEKLVEKFPKRLELNVNDFYSFSKILFKDMNTDSKEAEKMLEGVEENDWEGSPPIVIVGVLPPQVEPKFLTFCIYALCRSEGFYTKGRIRLLMFVSGKQLSCMFAKPSDTFKRYRGTSVLYQTLFDIAVLHKEPKSSFFPPLRCKEQVTDWTYVDDHMYLISMTPKLDLHHLVSSREKLYEFVFFVVRHMARRTSPVVASLEQLIPGVGPHVLKMGFSLFTVFGDLLPSDFAAIYKEFTLLPEYSTSAFVDAAAKSSLSGLH